jgi:hypothetical protein
MLVDYWVDKAAERGLRARWANGRGPGADRGDQIVATSTIAVAAGDAEPGGVLADQRGQHLFEVAARYPLEVGMFTDSLTEVLRL